MLRLLSLLALLLAAPLAAQTPSRCDARDEPLASTALDRHRAAVRALPGRVDVEDVPCVAPIARLWGAVGRAAEGSIEVQQTWSEMSQTWATTGRILRALGENGDLAERVRQSPVGTGWLNVEQTLFAGQGADEIQTVSRWGGDVWVPATRVTYLYRDDQRSLGDRSEIWDADAGRWRIASERTVGYDAQDRLILVLTEALDPVSLQTLPVDRTQTTYSADGRESVAQYQRWQAPDGWIPSTQTTVVTDADGNRLSVLTEAREGGAWVPRDRTLYDLGGAVDTVRSQTWAPGLGVWENTFQTLRTVAGLQSQEITQSWADEAWVNVSRIETLVDASGRLVDYVVSVWEADAWDLRRRLRRDYAGDALVGETAERWDDASQMWRLMSDAASSFIETGAPLRRVTRTYATDGATITTGGDTMWAYDTADRLVSRTTTSWDVGAMAWVNASRSLFEYGSVPVASEAGPEGLLELSVSPNPAVGEAVLRLTTPASGSVRVDLYSVTGRLVQSVWSGPMPGGSRDLRLNVGALAPGVYLVRAGTEAGAVTRVVTVVR